VPFLHDVREAIIKIQRSRRGDGRERHQEPRGRTATTSEEEEDIRQDLQEERKAGDRKSCSLVLNWATVNEVNRHYVGVDVN
jgi:hypothetical protein